jgi:hypothetical protein
MEGERGHRAYRVGWPKSGSACRVKSGPKPLIVPLVHRTLSLACRARIVLRHGGTCARLDVRSPKA